jgi:hypothetical protein
MRKAVEEVHCPKCGTVMVVANRKPLMFTYDIDEILYHCEKCDTNEKRTVERDSRLR